MDARDLRVEMSCASVSARVAWTARARRERAAAPNEVATRVEEAKRRKTALSLDHACDPCRSSQSCWSACSAALSTRRGPRRNDGCDDSRSVRTPSQPFADCSGALKACQKPVWTLRSRATLCDRGPRSRRASVTAVAMDGLPTSFGHEDPQERRRRIDRELAAERIASAQREAVENVRSLDANDADCASSLPAACALVLVGIVAYSLARSPRPLEPR